MLRLFSFVTLWIWLNGSAATAQNWFNVREYGATGQKEDYAQAAIQKAIDACHEAGGGRVYFPPGDYLSGTLVLKSHVTLYLEAGATLWNSRREADYENDFIVYKKNDSGKEGDGATPVFLYAKGAENIGIAGKGRIHGQATRTYEPLKKVDGFIEQETENARKAGVEMKMYYKVKPFTCMVFLEECKNVTIQDVSLIESTDWTLHFKWCEKVLVRGAQIYSSLEAGVNSDGIDVDGSKDVTISDCIIETGDDCIVLKTTQTFGEARPCENVTVNNCVLVSTSTALKLGTESFADFRHITFNNCVVRNTNRGLSIVIRDGATASDVLFSNITLQTDRKHFNWWGNGDPIWLVVKKRFPGSKVGKIERVRFQNIIATGQGTSKIEGFPGQPESISGITFSGVELHLEPEDFPDKRATHALALSNCQNISLKELDVRWSEATEPQWQSALFAENVQGLRVDGFRGRQGLPDGKSPVIELKNVRNAILERLHPTQKAATTLVVNGAQSRSLFLKQDGRAVLSTQTGKEVTKGALKVE